jgi:hypothetical protein
MAWALAVTVSLEGTERSEQMLREQIVPTIKQQAGFQSGTWMRSNDGTKGMGVVLYDTQANAEAARAALPQARPPGAPPVTNSDLFEVLVQA